MPQLSSKPESKAGSHLWRLFMRRSTRLLLFRAPLRFNSCYQRVTEEKGSHLSAPAVVIILRTLKSWIQMPLALDGVGLRDRFRLRLPTELTPLSSM